MSPGRCARDPVPGGARRRARCCGPEGPFGRRPRASGGCPCSAARSWRRTVDERAGRAVRFSTPSTARPRRGRGRGERRVSRGVADHYPTPSHLTPDPPRCAWMVRFPTVRRREGTVQREWGHPGAAGVSKMSRGPPGLPRPTTRAESEPHLLPIRGRRRRTSRRRPRTLPSGRRLRPRGTRRSGPGPPRTRPSPGGARRRRRSPPRSPPGAGGAPGSRRGAGT